MSCFIVGLCFAHQLVFRPYRSDEGQGMNVLARGMSLPALCVSCSYVLSRLFHFVFTFTSLIYSKFVQLSARTRLANLVRLSRVLYVGFLSLALHFSSAPSNATKTGWNDSYVSEVAGNKIIDLISSTHTLSFRRNMSYILINYIHEKQSITNTTFGIRHYICLASLSLLSVQSESVSQLHTSITISIEPPTADWP